MSLSYTQPSASKYHYIWLDFFRGCAALMVCLSHLRPALIIDYTEQTKRDILTKLFYFTTGLGHQSVVIFFVLSGFLVGGSVLRNNHFSLVQYLIARLSRLWTVLIPALLITLVIDSILSQHWPDLINGNLHHKWNSAPRAGEHSVSALTFFLNAIFLQTIEAPVYGTNGPLWSLANEFWYYISFPFACIFLGAFENKKKAITRLLALIIFVAIFSWLPRYFFYGFIVWLLGLVTWHVNTKYPALFTSRICVFLFGLVFFITLPLSKTFSASVNSSFYGLLDIIIGSTFCLFLISLQQQKKKIKRDGAIGIVSTFLSKVSFSLYLTHFPLVILLALLLKTQIHPYLPNFFGYVVYFSFAVFFIFYAWLVWWLFERHTDKVKGALQFLADKVILHFNLKALPK